MRMTLTYIYLTSTSHYILDAATATSTETHGCVKGWSPNQVLLSPKTLFIYGFTIQLHTHPPTYNHHVMHACCQ